MKKVLLALACIVVSTYGFGQQPLGQDNEASITPPKMKMTTGQKANQSTGWYNYHDEIQNVTSNWTQYLDYLFPDTLAKWVGSGGELNYTWKNSQGQVLDPTSNYFLFNAQKISKGATYTLDSIAIPYAYRRTQTGNPDTLLIQVYKPSAMTYVPNPSWTTPKSYCTPAYDYMSGRGLGAEKEIVVLLGDADTAVTFGRFINREVGISLDTNEEVALGIHYFPGNPYKNGDTLSRTVSGPNVINNFAMWNGVDGTPTIEMNYYNHGLQVRYDQVYNVNQNGWNGQYYPGVAYTDRTYHTDVFFQITYDDFTGIEEAKSKSMIDVYPNPARDLVNLKYDIQYGQKAQVEFRNLLGNTIHTEIIDVNGTNTSIDVSAWESGVYFYTLKIDNEMVGTSRLMVTK